MFVVSAHIAFILDHFLLFKELILTLHLTTNTSSLIKQHQGPNCIICLHVDIRAISRGEVGRKWSLSGRFETPDLKDRMQDEIFP